MFNMIDSGFDSCLFFRLLKHILNKAYNVGTSAVVVLQTNIMFMCICNASSIVNFLFIVFFYFADRPTLFFSPICMRNIKNNNDALELPKKGTNELSKDRFAWIALKVLFQGPKGQIWASVIYLL